MADNDVFHSQFLEHGTGDLSCKRTVVRPVDVLGADFDVGAFQNLDSSRKAGESRADCHRDGVTELCETFFESFRKSFGLRGGFVHFPVAGNKGFACHLQNSLHCCLRRFRQVQLNTNHSVI